jgi:hypothetical protein
LLKTWRSTLESSFYNVEAPKAERVLAVTQRASANAIRDSMIKHHVRPHPISPRG